MAPKARDGLSIDLATIPIERNLDEAMSGDDVRVRMALSVISAAAGAGRPMASVFLMGFLVSRPPGDWKGRTRVVEALRCVATAPCARLLFSELRHTRSDNTTRVYLSTLIEILRRFPEELVRPEFEGLAMDRSFSPRMRRKFSEILGWNEDPFDGDDDEPFD
jgi:hypothetical protein